MIGTKLHTELVSLVETTYGEAILTMQRGKEEKELVIAETGLSGVVYDSAIDYYMYDLNWTEEQFDNYWETVVKIRKSTITLTELLSITMIGPLGKKLLNL